MSCGSYLWAYRAENGHSSHARSFAPPARGASREWHTWRLTGLDKPYDDPPKYLRSCRQGTPSITAREEPLFRAIYLTTLVWPISMPSFRSSPWIFGAPHNGLAILILQISRRNSNGTVGRP